MFIVDFVAPPDCILKLAPARLGNRKRENAHLLPLFGPLFFVMKHLAVCSLAVPFVPGKLPKPRQ